MKRKHVKEVFSEENIAVKGTKIILEDLKEHPWCSHGPSILFEKNGGEKYYACAAFRNRKQCVRNLPAHLPRMSKISVGDSI